MGWILMLVVTQRWDLEILIGGGWIHALIKENTEALASPSITSGHIKKVLSMNQKVDFHQTPNLVESCSWTSQKPELKEANFGYLVYFAHQLK